MLYSCKLYPIHTAGGDNLILDPFDPATEHDPCGAGNFDNVGQHTVTSAQIPTDVFISEYIEGLNQQGRQSPPGERDPEQRNRVIELYNGGEASDDLKDVVKALNEADIFSEILISGHTCDLGPDAYNLALSERRADSVRN